MSRDTRNSKASNIRKTRVRVRRSTKIINFPNTPVLNTFPQNKINKTNDDSENGASLSQIGRRCPTLI